MAKREVRTNPRKKLLLVLLLAVVAVLALLLLAGQNLTGMVNALSNANYLLIGLAIFVYVFGMAIWSLRWGTGVSAVGKRAGRKSLFLAVWGSTFINNVTPFTYSGGDPFARTYLLNRLTKTPFSSGFAVIAAEYILDMPVFLSLLAFGLLSSFWRAWTLPIFFLLVIVLTAGIPLALRFLHGRVAADRISGFIWRVVRLFRIKATRAKISETVRLFYTGAYNIVHKKKCALTMAAFGGIFWTFIMVRLMLVFLALGYSPPIQMLMLAVTLPAVVGLVPVLPAGLGTVDAAFYFIYTSFGVDPTSAVSVILIDRLITFVLGTLIGAGALSYLGIRLSTKKS